MALHGSSPRSVPTRVLILSPQIPDKSVDVDNRDGVTITQSRVAGKLVSLNLSQFVARKYWLRHYATLHRFRANLGKKGEPSRGVCLYIQTNFNHLQTLIN